MIFRRETVLAAVLYLIAFFYLGAGNAQLGWASGLIGTFFLAIGEE